MLLEGEYPSGSNSSRVCMNYRKHLKAGIRLVIEADANPVTIIIRLSKKQVFAVLDHLIPDE
jgi:hypothetical protein